MISLPGFTAEGSLYKAKKFYQAIKVTGRGEVHGQSVVPQGPSRFPPYPSCHYVWEYLCPLCDPNTGVCPPCFWNYTLVCPGRTPPPR
jgi:hypothetical protein